MNTGQTEQEYKEFFMNTEHTEQGYADDEFLRELLYEHVTELSFTDPRVVIGQEQNEPLVIRGTISYDPQQKLASIAANTEYVASACCGKSGVPRVVPAKPFTASVLEQWRKEEDLPSSPMSVPFVAAQVWMLEKVKGGLLLGTWTWHIQLGGKPDTSGYDHPLSIDENFEFPEYEAP